MADPCQLYRVPCDAGMPASSSNQETRYERVESVQAGVEKSESVYCVCYIQRTRRRRHPCRDGRVVKAMDLKGRDACIVDRAIHWDLPRRFKSCSRRQFDFCTPPQCKEKGKAQRPSSVLWYATRHPVIGTQAGTPGHDAENERNTTEGSYRT